MRLLLTALFLALPFAALPVYASAQDAPEQLNIPDRDDQDDGSAIILPAPEALTVPQIDTPLESTPENQSDTQVEIDGENVVPEVLAPDYSKLSPSAERTARLDDLFVKLAETEDAQSATLVAEEIYAIWTESGSASVNLLLRRGSEAEAKGNPKLARIMYNHTVDLAPDFSEAWARSARLALTQKKYNRALNESLKTLELEPRHFYTLWTMGNVLEVLNRPDEALEAYRESNRLYPELKAVKDRLAELDTEVNGTAF
jgi:tetratricopeptide (TPR) repeat protein